MIELTAGQAAVIAALRHAGYPINRENYIAFNWDETPDPWTAEAEDELPDFLREGYDAGTDRGDAQAQAGDRPAQR